MGEEAFLLLCQQNNSHQLQLMMEEGLARGTCRDDKNRTPLHFAVSFANLHLVRYLINQGADVSATDCNGNSPLHLATIGHQPGIVSMLMEAGVRQGVNPLVADRIGKTPLQWLTDRMHYLRSSVYKRRLQFVDEEEKEEIRAKILSELQAMINHLSSWASSLPEPHQASICPVVNQLTSVAGQVAQSDDLDQLDDLFSQLSI